MLHRLRTSPPLVSPGLLSTLYQDDFPKVHVLYHRPPPQQVFSFLLALWITSSWQSQHVLGLGRALSSCIPHHCLPTWQSCSHPRLLSIFCCLLLSCLGALASYIISGPTSFSSLAHLLAVPSEIFSLGPYLGPICYTHSDGSGHSLGSHCDL